MMPSDVGGKGTPQDLGLNEYQRLTEKTANYPKGKGDVRYLALAIGGEAGEVQEKVKKAWREDDDAYLDDLEDELGDVLWYLARLADELDLDLADVAERNIEKTYGRLERGQIQGEGDNR